jgi:hypothetical protein
VILTLKKQISGAKVFLTPVVVVHPGLKYDQYHMVNSVFLRISIFKKLILNIISSRKFLELFSGLRK